MLVGTLNVIFGQKIAWIIVENKKGFYLIVKSLRISLENVSTKVKLKFQSSELDKNCRIYLARQFRKKWFPEKRFEKT